MKTKHAGLMMVAALAMLALCGCGPVDVADVPHEAGDTAELAEGPEHGVMEYPAALLASEPLQGNSVTAWWKRIWAKIKAAIEGDDDPPAPTPDPQPPAPDPEVPPSNTFLWKPVSEAYSGRAVALLPSNIEATAVTCNGETGSKHPRANGNRQHFRFSKTGADYGANVKVVATLTGGGVKAWTVPDGGARWQSR